jgi:hypothetical protein
METPAVRGRVVRRIRIDVCGVNSGEVNVVP